VIQNKIRRTKTSNIFQAPAVLVAGRQKTQQLSFQNMLLNFPRDKNLEEYTTKILHVNNININCKVLKEEI